MLQESGGGRGAGGVLHSKPQLSRQETSVVQCDTLYLFRPVTVTQGRPSSRPGASSPHLNPAVVSGCICLADRSEKRVALDHPRANVGPRSAAGARAPSAHTGGGVRPQELPEGHAQQLSTEAPARLRASLQSKRTCVVAPGTWQTWTPCPFVPVRVFVAGDSDLTVWLGAGRLLA